jgi:hypothetical protein
MTQNIFVAPCDAGNFDRTVTELVDLTEYPDRPEALRNLDSARLWGARDGSRNIDFFNKMEADDLVLFYEDDNYVGVGRIETTFEDDAQWVSTTFWNDAPSKHIYTLSKFAPISVPKRHVNRIFDYSENYNPQGLMRIGDRRITAGVDAIEHAIKVFDEKY